MISVENVSKSFVLHNQGAADIPVMREASLNVAAGECVALIGASGAGKSTLLGALCGFIPLRSGRLLWQGKDITQAAPGARPMTMLFQDNNLFPHLSVMQNVGLGLGCGKDFVF